ncbi:peptidase [Gordonia sp. TBRC 11910]|uniref:Peptidase n=1 Tax=Gordonia asplenii TaxID=2725283 RepID=A0A848KU76_9ACTN|nr:NTF2-like N-terminal transpeptidase domain-containing protein [Gordonia asplenii]NMO02454.1 peptidase [Gordonia asplenii]
MKIWVKRAPIALTAAVACGLAISSCGAQNSSDTAAGAANEFASAFARQDATAAADSTTAPGQASDFLTATLTAMHAGRVDVAVHKPVEYSDGTASFSMKTTYTWAKDRQFETTTAGTLRKLSSGWKIQWEPGLLYTGMSRDAQLREIRTDATPAPTVRSASGKTFMYLQPVNQIVLDPSKTNNVKASVAGLVRAISPIAPLITADVVNQMLARKPGEAIIAVTLRNSDMQVLASDPAKVAGVSINRTGQLVMADRRLNSPLEVGLTNYWQAIRDATSGWQVQLVQPGQRPVALAGEQGPAGPNVPTSINQQVQLTLGDAAVEVAQPATILALDADSGGILGMAQNDAAAARGISLDQTYPVGSTLNQVFATVSRVASSSPVTDETLLDRLGLGVKFTVPGAAAPMAGNNVGTIDYKTTGFAASMLNMGALGVAMARAADNAPTSVAPFVIAGTPTKVTGGELGPLDSALTTPILAAMSMTAKNGDASDLTRAGGLKALVGTNGPQGPGWFVGVQDHKVIVIYTEGAQSGTAALQVAQKYFTIK